jgi:hypothetical protein
MPKISYVLGGITHPSSWKSKDGHGRKPTSGICVGGAPSVTTPRRFRKRACGNKIIADGRPMENRTQKYTGQGLGPILTGRPMSSGGTRPVRQQGADFSIITHNERGDIE